MATFTVNDDDETATVDFTAGTNDNGYYTIVGNEVQLTQAGVDYLNANGGQVLPDVSLSTSGTSTPVTTANTVTTTLVDGEINENNSSTNRELTLDENTMILTQGSVSVADSDTGDETIIVKTNNFDSIDLGAGDNDTVIIDTTDSIVLNNITNVENIQIHKSGDIIGNTGADTVTITSNNIGTIDLNEGQGAPLDTVVINTSESIDLSKLDHVEMIEIAEGQNLSGFDFDDLASSISDNPDTDDIIRIVDTAEGNSETITINLSEFKDGNGDGTGDISQTSIRDGITYDRYETTQGHFIDIEQTLTIDWQ